MDYTQTNKPKFLNLDKHPKYLSPEESFYLLNSQDDEENGVSTPLPSNYLLCDMELPAGSNHNAGRFRDEITNEIYSWTWNSNGAHFITRTKEDGTCEIVYYGECLKVSINPRYEIVKNRAQLIINRLCNKVPTGILKHLMWVDGNSDEIFFIDVEASIATENFSTPFFDICRDDCAYIQLCVPQPQGCINAEYVPLSPEDNGKVNYITDKGLKFMYQHEYYDGRRSEWSDRSSLYYIGVNSCFSNDSAIPRCMKFDVPMGNPMVDKINIGVSEDGGVSYYLYDTIQKYNEYNSNQFWYERTLREGLAIDYEACTIEYTFCNDRQRVAISDTQLTREYNPQPRKVQGLVPMPKGAIGFYNYVKGVCPLSINEIDKIKVSADCENTNVCADEIVEVKVRAIIYNFYLSGHGNNTASWFIYRHGGANGSADDPDDIARFGSPLENSDSPIYGQQFTGKARNFIPYIEGTQLTSEMTQWKSSKKMASVSKVGVIANQPDSQVVLDPKSQARSTAAFFYQEASFFVKKGTKGFIRIGSHTNDNSLGQNQNTSTQVKGTFNIRQYNGDNNLPSYKDGVHEVYFDTCTGVTEGILDLSEAFVIEDLYTAGSGKKSSAYNGYIYDAEGLPVEGAQIKSGGVLETVTDHNGFYSFYIFDGTSDPVGIDVFVEKDCGAFQNIGSFSSSSGELQVAYTDYTIDDVDYLNNHKQKVKVQVVDCDNVGVPGMTVAISGSKSRVTEPDGFAYFTLRNYNTRNRKVTTVVMDGNGCIETDCDGNCNPCMPSTNAYQLPACFSDSTNVILLGGALQINNKSALIGSDRGLKSGGRYPFGVVAEGDCGKISAVYDIGYLEIPKTQDKGYLGFCNLNFNIENTFALPSWVSSLKLVRGENIDKFLLQWVVDDIERTSNGFLKLTIQSLNDYNSLNGFKTNTSYKFAEGDVVEFIKNGDGSYFTDLINVAVSSPYNDTIISGVTDAPADFFNQILIKDLNPLSNLKKGAIIEIKRSQLKTEKPTYFGICASIPIEDGKPISFAGTFKTFDTYIISRQIGKFPSQKFEHWAPSDRYNSIISDDRGKVYFKNEYENEARFGRNITVNSPTIPNYFGDFEKTFDIAQQGDIILLNIKDEKIGLGISEKDNFIFSVADDLLRVGSDNVVHAASVDSLISSPEAKIRGKYGCQYEDIGSIYFGDGYATWIDYNANDYIIHNYREAKRAAFVQGESTCSTYFKKIIREKEYANNLALLDEQKYRYATGCNTQKQLVFLTIKRAVDAGINNSKEAFSDIKNRTIVYDPNADRFKNFVSFTPEGYIDINLKTEDGAAFMVYQNSLPFVHPIESGSFNKFFEVACDWVVGATLNKGVDKLKTPISIEVQSKTMFYVYRVYNENYLSEIPPAKVVKNKTGKWNLPFLKNINSVGGLYQGKSGVGYYFNVILIRDNTVDLKVNTVNEDKMELFSSLDTINFKFSIAEQSGYTENL